MASESKITTRHFLNPQRLVEVLWRLVGLFRPGWLTGPIFDKELRVSSRRRRNYVLRFVYLILLSLFVVLVWMETVDSASRSSAAYRISRMSEAGKVVVGCIIWFQFCATQLIAVVMLSTAISDEIYNRTLAVLMTTPINSFQIVMGKVLSKLWQLMILLAISLPLLAVVRVFGGVPWEYVVSSLCMTLAAIVFAGSVSMYFSIRNRRAYRVILRTLFIGAFLYAFVPFLVVMGYMQIWGNRSQPNTLLSVFFHTNPFIALATTSQQMFSPTRGSMPFFSWPLHCAAMLGASAVVLGLTIRAVRKVALRQATGEAGIFTKSKRKGRGKRRAMTGTSYDTPIGQIRRVRGQPVVWKELRSPILRGGKIRTVIGILAVLASLFTTYALCSEFLNDDGTHIIYVVIFVVIGIVGTAVLSATSITSERESRAWPILLATSLSNWQIIVGKAIGVFRKCLPVWILLFGHVLLFIIVGFIHWIVLLHMFILVLWLVLFFTGSGVYFSSRFKKTTTAVIMNLTLGLVLWLVLPFTLVIMGEISSGRDEEPMEACFTINPVVQAVIVLEGGAGERNANRPVGGLDYDWPLRGQRDSGAVSTTKLMLATMAGYSLLGLLFAWRAGVRLRRDVF